MTVPKPTNPTVAKVIYKTRRTSSKPAKNRAGAQASPLTTAQASFTPDRYDLTSFSGDVPHKPYEDKFFAQHTPHTLPQDDVAQESPHTPSQRKIFTQESSISSTPSARRVLDFSNIKVRAQTTDSVPLLSTVTTLGELSFRVFIMLNSLQKNHRFLGKQIPSRFRQCKVKLRVNTIRIPDFASRFSFVLFAEYTGSLSIGAQTGLFLKSAYFSALESTKPQ